ncbi:hypothetical protein [Amycolatopsis azurea]|uniref:hypothetical protein n=1 Tax=Amycolatopsis azurea TaxID=36819 RepID=UPI001178B98E|nr:hypothetical protein [Amycolatopsis azurea]
MNGTPERRAGPQGRCLRVAEWDGEILFNPDQGLAVPSMWSLLMRDVVAFDTDFVSWAAAWAQLPTNEQIPFAVTSLREARERTGLSMPELVEQAQHQVNETWRRLQGINLTGRPSSRRGPFPADAKG